MSMTLKQVERTWATDAACKQTLMELRWPAGVTCPRCGASKRVYALKARPFHWACKNAECGGRTGYRFSVLKGSIFENSNVPLPTWFQVIYLMVTSKKGISANQIARMIEPSQGGKKVDYRTAWTMCHRIRTAMQNDQLGPLTGHVEIDETYVGGKNKNRHGGGRGYLKRTGRRTPETTDDKAKVIGAMSRAGNVVCRVIDRVDERTVGGFVDEVVADRVSVSTDQASVYKHLDWDSKGIDHDAVNHHQGEYVRGAVHTANLDSFWSLLKRGVVGTFHNVSKKYLPLYVAEFSFRHNHRDDPEVFQSVLSSC